MESAFLPILFSFWKKYRGALHLCYTKEGKTDKHNITISSYARDIANEAVLYCRCSSENQARIQSKNNDGVVPNAQKGTKRP